MLGWRVGISVVLIPLLFFIFWLDHQSGANAYYLLGLCVLLVVRSTWELTRLLRTRTIHPGFWPLALANLALLFAAWQHPRAFEWMMIVFVGEIVLLFLYRAVRFEGPGTTIETLGCEFLTIAYLGLLFGTTVQLRWIDEGRAGYLALGSLIIVAKVGDIGGYTLGRLFGKKKLVPRLSPGKTWMGGLGAVLGGILASLLWFHFVPPLFNESWSGGAWYVAVLYGAIVAVVGLIGDLCESLIKRDVGVKDSAPLLPGFGGLLDLLDSVIYAGPVAYMLWRVLPPLVDFGSAT